MAPALWLTTPAYDATAVQQALQQAVELWYARRHSLRSCPPRDLVRFTAADRYPLGSLSPERFYQPGFYRFEDKLRLLDENGVRSRLPTTLLEQS